MAERIRKPKPRVVSLAPRAPRREMAPSVFGDLTGAKLWTCHSCGGTFDAQRPFEQRPAPAGSPFSSVFAHPACS